MCCTKCDVVRFLHDNKGLLLLIGNFVLCDLIRLIKINVKIEIGNHKNKTNSPILLKKNFL